MNSGQSLEENIHSAFRNTDEIRFNNRIFDIEKHFAGEGYDNPFYTAEKSVSLRKILRNTANSIMTGIATLPLFIGGPGTIFAGETPSVEDHLNRDTPREVYNPQSEKDKKKQKKTEQKPKKQETTTETTNPYKIDLLDIRIGNTPMEDIREGEIIRGVPYGERIYVKSQDAKDDRGLRTNWGIKPVSKEEYNALLKTLSAEERKRIKQNVDADAKGTYDLDKFGYIAVRGRRVVSDDESQNLTALGVAQGELVKIIADFEKDEVTQPEESTYFYVVYGKKQTKEEKEQAQPKETARPSRKDTPYKLPIRERWTHRDTRAQPKADEPQVQTQKDDFKPAGILDIGGGLLDMGYTPAEEEDPGYSFGGFKVRGLFMPNNSLTVVINADYYSDSDWIGGNASENFTQGGAKAHGFLKAPKIPLGIMASLVAQGRSHNGINSLYSNFENLSSSDIAGTIGAGILTPQNKEFGLYAMGVIGAKYHTLNRDQISGNMVRASHRNLSEGRLSKGYVVGVHLGRLTSPASLELQHGKDWNSSLGTIIGGQDNHSWDIPLIFESGTDEYFAAQLSARIKGPIGVFVNARAGRVEDIYEDDGLNDITKYFTITGGVRITFNPNK